MDLDARRLSLQLDPLPFPARQRVLADTARSLAGTAALSALLAELDGLGSIPRRWAVTMAAVAGDVAYLRRCLTVPELGVAVVAMGWCVRRGLHSDVIGAALPVAPKAWRQALYNALRSYRAAELAQRLLPVVRDRFGDHEAAALLTACGPAMVAALLPELDFAVPNVVALARQHPGVLLDHLRRRLVEAGEAGRAAVWARYACAAAEAILADPGRVLDLLEGLGPVTGLPVGLERRLPALARVDPERLIAILADSSRRIRFRSGRALCLALRRAGDGALVSLARSVISDGPRLEALLRGLQPSRRTAVLEGALGGRDLVQAGLPVSVLDALPWPARHAHARRLLGTRPVADNPHLRLEVVARLPWPEAEPALRAETARSTAAERARAYPLLISAAAATRDPETVGWLLSSLTRLPNEQDPVRSPALQAIAAMPAWLFRLADIAALDKLTTDAVQARDVSWATRHAVSTLAIQVVRHGVVSTAPELVDCGLQILHRAGGHSRTLTLYRLDRDLPRGAEHAVFDVLRPRIDADARQGRHELALSLAEGLHRRAWAMPGLQEYIATAVSATQDSTVRRAIDLWLAPPASRDERVEVLLRGDPSVITLSSVAAAVSRRRHRPVGSGAGQAGARPVPQTGRAVCSHVPRPAPSLVAPTGHGIRRSA